MFEYYVTATIICPTCMRRNGISNDPVLGTTGNIMTPCALCGRDGADYKIMLIFNDRGIRPGNEMLMAHLEGK